MLIFLGDLLFVEPVANRSHSGHEPDNLVVGTPRFSDQFKKIGDEAKNWSIWVFLWTPRI